MPFGLVFAGGGVRGAYHIGVWKAIDELKVKVCAVSGTSIGAINGALFTQGDLETATKLWEKIALDDIVSLPPEMENISDLFSIKTIIKIAKQAYKNAGLDMKPLEKLLHEVLNEEKVRSSNIDFGFTAYSLTEKKQITLYKNEIPQGSLIDYLMASACLPGFKSVMIGEEKFIDGAITNNMPTDLMIRKGIDDIITVNAKGVGFYRDFNTSGINIISIECLRPRTGTMDFDRNGIKDSIKEGYLDCKQAFGYLFGKEAYIPVREYTCVRTKYGKDIIDGIQHAAHVFGVDLLREISFETLIKETVDAYERHKSISVPELNKINKSVDLNRPLKFDDVTVISYLVEKLDKKGFDFVKSKLDILGRNYYAASALLYFKRKNKL